MTIRNYTRADRDACVELYCGNMPKFFDPSELKRLEHWLSSKEEERLAHPGNISEHYYVAERNNKVLASGGFYITDKREAHLTWGMVANALHRQGVGSVLLTYRIDRIRELFPDCPILLDTTQHSFRFFEKLGFRVEKITPQFYGPELDRYDMVWMAV